MTALDQDSDAAQMFKALGDPTRLQILKFLLECCCPVAVEESGDVRPIIGPTVGEVCCQVTGVDQITSRVSFHLKELRLANLITMERRGKNMICSANQEAVNFLVNYQNQSNNTNNSGDCCR